MKEKKIIKNLEEYLKKIDAIFSDQGESTEFLYRGQADNYWPLKSSACRFFSNSYPILPLSQGLMEEYIGMQEKTIKKFTNEENPQYSLRHFGGHTPYIDFSRNCLVALYFACEELQGQEDGIVYILNTSYLKELSAKLDDNGKEKKEAEFRIKFQNACLVFPLGVEIDKDSDKLEMIIIDKNAKKEILRQLEQLQISRTTIYPDLMEYIRHQGQYTDVFKEKILEEIMRLTENDYQRYPAKITSLLNLQNYKRVTNNERKIIYCKLIEYYIKNSLPDKALELLDDKALKEDRIIESDQKTSVIYKYDNKKVLTILSYEKGLCYIQKQMYRSAINEFNKAIEDIKEGTLLWRSEDLVENTKTIVSKSHDQIEYLNIKLAPENINKTIPILNPESDAKEREKNAALYFECEKFHEAIEELGNLESDSILNLIGRCFIGLFKIENGDYIKKARDAFRKAIEKTPNKINSLAHRYELAATYHGWEGINSNYNDMDEAICIYKELAGEPFFNEEAKHRVAKYTHEKAHKEDDLDFDILVKAVDEYIKAIEERKSEHNATNFVDLGDIFFDIYEFKKKYPERIQETNKIKTHIHEKLSNKLIKFRESGQTEVRKLMQTIRDTKLTEKDSLLLMNTYLLQIAIAIYPEDEYAFNKLGRLYDDLFENSNITEYADKALAAYNRSRYYYIKKGMYYKKHKSEDGIDLIKLDEKINDLIIRRYEDENKSASYTG